MPTLGEYVNTYNSALETLRRKGFQLWYDQESDMFCAERCGWDFMADTPIALLGLVALFEDRAPSRYEEYWWRDEGQMDHMNLPRAPQPYASVMQKGPTGEER